MSFRFVIPDLYFPTCIFRLVFSEVNFPICILPNCISLTCILPICISPICIFLIFMFPICMFRWVFPDLHFLVQMFRVSPTWISRFVFPDLYLPICVFLAVFSGMYFFDLYFRFVFPSCIFRIVFFYLYFRCVFSDVCLSDLNFPTKYSPIYNFSDLYFGLLFSDMCFPTGISEYFFFNYLFLFSDLYIPDLLLPIYTSRPVLLFSICICRIVLVRFVSFVWNVPICICASVVSSDLSFF